jgi:23S rRNA maturation-related 3'-5' exoribonuclease YhaM
VKAADFVGYLFLARDVAHSVHLNTRSFAKHKALQEFYEGIVDHADAFAEAYQGRHGLIGPISLLSAKKTTNIVEFLEDQLADIEKCRYEVAAKEDSSLQQLIDNIVELYLSTLYKLRFLT